MVIKFLFLLSFTQGKDYDSFIKEIGQFFTELIFVKYNNKYLKAENVENLMTSAKKYDFEARSFDNLNDAYDYVYKKENTDLILITGSLYLASNYRDMLTKK